MTDNEKLTLLQNLEEGFWDSLQRGGLSSGWLNKNIESIEHCQRIRASLKGSVIPFPVTTQATDADMEDNLPCQTWEERFIQAGKSLDHLNFIPHTRNALKRNGIDFNRLQNMSNDELLKIRLIGEKSLYEIRQKVSVP